MIMAMQIYAMRVYELAADENDRRRNNARVTMNDIRDRVRESRVVYAEITRPSAQFSPVDFSAVTNGRRRKATRLMIYPTTATNAFALIYLQTGERHHELFSPGQLWQHRLYQFSHSPELYTNRPCRSLPIFIASYITNDIVFDAENFEGTVLSNNENNYLVHLTLDFSQHLYSIGTNLFNAYDYYQLNTVMTRRDTD